MSAHGDDETEMLRRDPLDDLAAERLLTGHTVPGEEALVSFVAELTLAASTPGPQPAADLAALLADGFSMDKGDLPATAASNVNGPASQAAGLPKWRTKRKRTRTMIGTAIGKLAALGLVAKVSVATGAAALAGTAIAYTGELPPPAQERVADVATHVGIHLPGQSSDDDQDELDTDETTDPAGATPEEENHGATVSEAAQDHSHDEECGNHGKYVSSVARGEDSCLDDETATDPETTTSADDESEDESDDETSTSGQSVSPNRGKGKGQD